VIEHSDLPASILSLLYFEGTLFLNQLFFTLFTFVYVTPVVLLYIAPTTLFTFCVSTKEDHFLDQYVS